MRERVERPPRHEWGLLRRPICDYNALARSAIRAVSVIDDTRVWGGHMYENKSWRSPETAGISASEGAARPTSHALLRFECLAQRACEGVLRLLARVSGGRHVQRDVHLAPWWALVGAVGGVET